MADPRMKFYKTTKSKLNLLTITDGQLIFVPEERKLYLDADNERTEYSRIIVLATESQRLTLTRIYPDTFYFVQDTEDLWMYTSNSWILITKPQENEINFLSTLPDVGVPNKLYVSGENIYKWESGRYVSVGKSDWEDI